MASGGERRRVEECSGELRLVGRVHASAGDHRRSKDRNDIARGSPAGKGEQLRAKISNGEQSRVEGERSRANESKGDQMRAKEGRGGQGISKAIRKKTGESHRKAKEGKG